MVRSFVNADPEGMDRTRRPARLIVFAPLPPKENGIADYVFEQLPFHGRHCDTLVVIGNGDPTPVALPRGCSVLRLAEYLRQRPLLGAFPHVFHVGNNLDHGYMLPVLYNTPGVVVLHDLGLHHLIDTQTLEKGNLEGYAWALSQQYGRFGKILGRQFLDYRVKGQAMPHELTLNGAAIDCAQHVIVHSHYSANRIRSEWPKKPVTVIPHHLAPASQNYNRGHRRRYRAELGLPERGTIVMSLGFISRTKQVHTILGSLAELKAQGADFTYVLAGKCRKEEYDVFADIQRLNLEDRVIVTGYLSEEKFFKHVAAADLVLNLRYPTWGETSGTLIRALGMGCCCVVADIGPFAEIPVGCAAKIAWDEYFPEALLATLRRLVAAPELREAYEVAAREWIASTHGIQRTTRAYHGVIEAIASGSGAKPSRFGDLGGRVAIYWDKGSQEMRMCQDTATLRRLVSEGAGQLWWRECFLEAPGERDRIGVVTDQPEPLRKILLEWFDYDSERIEFCDPDEVMSAGLALECYRRYERLLVVVPKSRLGSDPVWWLGVLNWRLVVGGDLVLALRAGLEEDDPSIGIGESVSVWTTLLEAAGFEVMEGIEAPADVTYSGLDVTSAEPTFRARKLTERVDRFPKPLYVGQPLRHVILGTLGGNWELLAVTTPQEAPGA